MRVASRAFLNDSTRSRKASTLAIFSAKERYARSRRAAALRARISEMSG
jgi:hypothetical protein